MSFLTRRKSFDALAHVDHDHQLAKTLGWPHLVFLGIGGVIGVGIFTLPGIGAERAGPAVIEAFALSGLLCLCAALAYTEMATLLPVAGSAYTYTYSVLGEGLGWFVGWSLVLEYAVTCGAVAVGWSGYMVGLLNSAGIHLPPELLAGPHGGGIVNLPAVLISLAVAFLLARGAKESANFNIFLVAIKLAALAMFVTLSVGVLAPENFTPFSPYGFAAHADGGQDRGIMAAAAIVFFAYLGFDTVSTAAEEVKNPNRDLVIGIIGSLLICTAIFMVVSACAVGAMPFQQFVGSHEPLAFILRTLDHPTAALALGAAASIALPSVILVMMYGQTRVFFVMARDGLLPRGLSHIESGKRGPVRLTYMVGGFVAIVAGFFPLDEVAAMSNVGTLTAFAAVSICVMVLRKTRPDLKRVFRCPAVWIVAPAAVAGCIYFMISLPTVTMERFALWNVIGFIVYLVYGRKNSELAQPGAIDLVE